MNIPIIAAESVCPLLHRTERIFFFRSNESGTLEVYTERFKERHAFALKLDKNRRMSSADADGA